MKPVLPLSAIGWPALTSCIIKRPTDNTAKDTKEADGNGVLCGIAVSLHPTRLNMLSVLIRTTIAVAARKAATSSTASTWRLTKDTTAYQCYVWKRTTPGVQGTTGTIPVTPVT